MLDIIIPNMVSLLPTHFVCLAGLGLNDGILSVSKKIVRNTVDFPVSFAVEVCGTDGGVFRTTLF